MNNGYKYKFKKKSDSEVSESKEDEKIDDEYVERDAFLNWGQAVLSHSLFSEYMKKHGMTVRAGKRKSSESDDFLVMKYENGVGTAVINDEMKEPKSPDTLRLQDYTEGISVPRQIKKQGKPDHIHYKMLMRNPSKAKKGDCIFVKDSLYEKAMNYLTMGLYKKLLDKPDNVKIVEMSAYSTLVTATALDFMEISLDNIFVVEDQESIKRKRAYRVKTRDEDYLKVDLKDKEVKKNVDWFINKYGYTFYKKKANADPTLKHIEPTAKALKYIEIDFSDCADIEKLTRKACYVDRSNDESEIKNILWDGMGLIDESIFPVDKAVEMSGFVYLRSHFFKSCLFKGNIQEYFKDHYKDEYETAVVTDMFGRKMKVSDIKVVITENSLKWMKFIDLMGGTKQKAFKYYRSFMKKHGNKFSIVKTAHASKWGDFQRSSYQVNNSLPTTNRITLEAVAAMTVAYGNALKTDDDKFIEHLKKTNTGRYSTNNVLLALIDWNRDFMRTDYFKKKRAKIIHTFVNDRLKLGKLFQYGDNLTICGNPIGLLMDVIEKGSHVNEECFQSHSDRIQCHTTRFPEGSYLAGFRNPHNAPNNIVCLENVYPAALQKYFPELGNNVIIINGIETDVQSRLNGQDLDSDFVFVCDQKEIVELAKYSYEHYPTIINEIQKTGTSVYSYDMESHAKMDNSIAAAQKYIGEASDLAQLALSYYYHEGGTNKDLEDVFIICSVLAQVAIDSAKTSFDVNVGQELKRIKKLECMRKYKKVPRFFAEAKNLKDKDNPKYTENDIGVFKCPMDILYEIIDEGIIDLRKHKELNTETIELDKVFNRRNKPDGECDRKQRDKVQKIVKTYDEEVSKLNSESKDYHVLRAKAFEEVSKKLNNLKIKPATMYDLIAKAFDKGGTFCDRMLTLLFNKVQEENDGDCTIFLKNFVKNCEYSTKIL